MNLEINPDFTVLSVKKADHCCSKWGSIQNVKLFEISYLSDKINTTDSFEFYKSSGLGDWKKIYINKLEITLEIN